MFFKDDITTSGTQSDTRTNASQNRAAATMIAEEFFLRTQYKLLSPHISREAGGGQEIDGQHDTSRWSWLSCGSQPNLHTAEQGLQNLQNYFVTDKDE
jgi:hypothetical protein